MMISSEAIPELLETSQKKTNNQHRVVNVSRPFDQAERQEN